MLEHPNNRERLPADLDGLADGDDFMANFFRFAKERITNASANHANGRRAFIVDVIEEAAVRNSVQIHFENLWPAAYKFFNVGVLFTASDGRIPNGHFRRDKF